MISVKIGHIYHRQTLKNQAKSFVDSQVSIHGIGVQSHFGSTDIDMTQLKYRLDKVAEAGPPIWVTELSIKGSNFTAKAQALEDVLTMYFSHKKVAGVILWGFWGASLKWQANAATPTVVVNKAGNKYMELVNSEWRTNWTEKLKTYKNRRYFKGQYSIKIKKDGVTLKTIA
ncbi:anti-sigma-I factor RsgI6-like [Pecten maximus]|uniref:anti-sigma-I factor RsgI6-like n=1 Tax=Pecten maximus TaxID=6579 RepID=UPI0014591620|nr:anti-sigma-I factor RsgI6-like [Pecten maximus]